MKIVTCEVCRQILFAVDDNGLILLTHAFARNIDGVCECGHGFHYSVTDRLLERIIERYNQMVEVVE